MTHRNFAETFIERELLMKKETEVVDTPIAEFIADLQTAREGRVVWENGTYKSETQNFIRFCISASALCKNFMVKKAMCESS